MRHKRKLEEIQYEVDTLRELRESLSETQKILPLHGVAKIVSMDIEVDYIVDLCSDISILYVSEMCYAPGGLYMRLHDSDELHLCNDGEITRCLDTKTNEVLYQIGVTVELPGFEAQSMPIFVGVGPDEFTIGKIFAKDYLIKP